MDETLATLQADGLAAYGWMRDSLFQTPTFAQLGVVAVLLVAALLATPALRRGLHARIARMHQARPVPQILSRLADQVGWLCLALALLLAIAVFDRLGLPVAVIRLAVSFAFAWIVIRLISQLVRNEGLARSLAVLAFVLAALNIAGLLPALLALLDSAAITIGTLRLSVLLVIKGSITLALALWLAGLAARVAETRLRGLAELTPSMQVLAAKLVRFALIMLAILLALGAVGIDLTAFAVFSGAVGVGVGLGLQKVIANLVSGVILLLDRSIKPGDVIEVGGTFGWITSLNTRYVSVATREGKEILIPNEDLITEKVTNWSFSNDLIRQQVEFGISYDSDVHAAIRLAIEAAAGTSRVLTEPKPVCTLTEFADSSLMLRLRFWINDPTNGIGNVRSAVMLRVWDLFRERGIEFPFPQRDITLRNPEALAAALATGRRPRGMRFGDEQSFSGDAES